MAGGEQTADSTVGKQLDDWKCACDSFARSSIPAPSIEVDTTAGYVPDLAAILAFVNRSSDNPGK